MKYILIAHSIAPMGKICEALLQKQRTMLFSFFLVGAPAFCPYIYLFFSNRGLGPWGPGLVRRYTSARFGTRSTGELLTDQESTLLTGIFLVNN